MGKSLRRHRPGLRNTARGAARCRFLAPSDRRLRLEALEERAMMSLVTSLGPLLYTAFPGEPNDVTVTPGALTHVNDNPNISLLSTCPSAEFLRGMSIGVEVGFIVGGSISFPTIPFDLPDSGVICPSIAGFGSMFTGALATQADAGSASVVAGAPIPKDGELFAKVSADGTDPITDYKLFQVVADPSQTHTDTSGDLQADGSVFRSASPTTGRIITGDVATGERDRYTFDAAAGKRYVVMLDQNPERFDSQTADKGTITSTRLKAYTVAGAITNSPLAQNVSAVAGNAIGPFSVASNQKIVVDVENTGAGAGKTYRMVVAEFDNADATSQPEGPQTIASADPGLPRAITDNATITSTLAVSGFSGTITDIDVTLNIDHTYDSDLKVFLVSPTGTRVELFTHVGSDGNNFTNTTLDDGFSFNPITGGSAPFSSTFSPAGLLSALNGENANGTWTLEVSDDATNDTGALKSWSVKITTNGNSDTKATATSLGAGKFGSAAIDPARDNDYWKRAGVTQGSLAFAYVDTSNSANKDSRLELSMDSDLVPFDQADDGGPQGISEESLKSLQKQFEKSGLTGGTDLTTVILNLGDRDDRSNLRAVSLPTETYGGTGMDAMIGGLQHDLINGQEGSDIIEGSAGDDLLIGGSGDDTFIVDTEYGPVQTDTVYGGDQVNNPATNGFDTIYVPSNAQKNEITVSLDSNGPYQAILDVSGITTRFIIPNNDVDAIQISGGDGTDTLTFTSAGLSDDETVIYVRGPAAGTGAVYVVDSTGATTEPPIAFDGVEQVNLLEGNLTRADGSSRLIVVYDASPELGANDTISLATHLGAGGAVNLDPAIFPAGDVDTFQFVAESTGTLSFRALFEQNPSLPGDGKLAIEVRDARGNLIASGTDTDDGQAVTISAVKGQIYFLRVSGASGPAINSFDLTAINTPAPIPTAVVLDPTADSGINDLDLVTGQTSQLRYLIHADLRAFASAGIAMLTPAEADAGASTGAAVQVFNEGLPVGYAAAVAGTNNTLFEITLDANLAKFPTRGTNSAGALGYDGYLNFVTAAVVMFDGQHNASNVLTPVSGRTALSAALTVTVDNVAPLPSSAPDLLTTCDSAGCPGSSATDNITNVNPPAFGGTGEANAIVRVFANGVQVGIASVGSDATDGLLGNGLGTWEVTVEPLDDGVYTIRTTLEDLAGNIGALSEPLSITLDTSAPQRPTLDLADISDSGRNNKDNITNDLLTALPGLLRFRVTSDPGTMVIIKDGNTVIDGPFLMPAAGFIFRDIAGTHFAADRNYLLSAEANDLACNVSPQSEELSVEIDRTLPVPPSIRLHPLSDSGVGISAATLFDSVTNDTTPQFAGTAESDAIVRLFVQLAAGPLADGLTVAVPIDGNQASLGQWNVPSVRNLNDSTAPFAFDGLRDMRATAEDRAGNISPQGSLLVFVDTQGPQITNVQITGSPNYNLFGLKPGNAGQGPTPAVRSLTISLRDLAARDANFLYGALVTQVALTPGTFAVLGDATGQAEIENVVISANPPTAGQPATGTIQIVFAEPLPDDRFTLTVRTKNLVDPAGNQVDGENNGSEPTSAPSFPTGDGLPGGDFISRFTVDSRPEIGNYSAGNAFIDANGNWIIDPQGLAADYSNRDLVFQIGTVSDRLFAGQFEPPTAALNDNDGYDKLGAFGYDNAAKKYRFLFDFDHDGIADQRIVSAFQVNGVPVAGNFAPGRNGDEIGLFDGKFWYLDNVGDNQLHLRIATTMRGQPIVGDFNGDGVDDLATYDSSANVFYFDTNRDGRTDDTLAFTGPLNGTTETPLAGDLNLDGIDDLGLRISNRQGSPTPNIAEWYFVLSDHTGQALPHNVFDTYSPDPLGNDLFAQFGDYFSLPIFGNFDPPVGAGTVANPLTNTRDSLDVNNDGVVAPNDTLTIINYLNAGSPQEPTAEGEAPAYLDVNGDGFVSPLDCLVIVNFLNSDAADLALIDATDAAAGEGLTGDANALLEDLLGLLASEMVGSKRNLT